MPDLAPGDVLWVAPDAAVGREQSGRRPAMVVAGADYLQLIDSLAVVVPLTSVDRGWPNHIRVSGAALPSPSWAMTEQVRTISRDRIVDAAGRADADTLRAVRAWIRDLLELN